MKRDSNVSAQHCVYFYFFFLSPWLSLATAILHASSVAALRWKSMFVKDTRPIKKLKVPLLTPNLFRAQEYKFLAACASTCVLHVRVQMCTLQTVNVSIRD